MSSPHSSLHAPTSPVKPPLISTKTSRLPAPSLFVGPPSRNASALSVIATKRDPLLRQKSALSRPHDELATLKKPSDRAVDTKWLEMQSTLNEVEDAAQSSTHVFGASHAAALDELRKAQVELARAWGRGNEEAKVAEKDEEIMVEKNRFAAAEEAANYRRQRQRADTEASASTVLSDESEASGLGDTPKSGAGRSQLEDETTRDIALASERRAANEAYFKKVDKGVKEVVARLDVVAEAMRGVEAESRSLWSASERSSRESEGEGRAGVREK